MNFGLAIFIVSQNFNSKVARLYFALGLCFATWNYGTFWMFRVHDSYAGGADPENAARAVFWARFLQFGVVFLLVLLNHVALLIARVDLRPYRKFIIFIYVSHVLLGLSNFTSFFITGVRNVGYAYYSVAGPGFWIWCCFFPLLPISVVVLLKKRQQFPPIHRKRLTPLIAAQTAFAFCACNDILPILGIDYYPFTHAQIYPFGSVVAIFYGLMIGYSVLQHQLLDIQVAFSRVAAKFIRLLFLFLVGLLFLLLMAVCQPDSFTLYSFVSGIAALLIGSLVASSLFPRLFGGAAESLERRILGDRFEYHDQIRSFIASMPMYTDTTLLMDDLHELLLRTINVRHYHIILFDNTSRTFSLFRFYPEQAVKQIPELRSDSAIFRFFETTESEYLALNIAYATPGGLDLEQEAREQLLKFDTEFCFPFFFDDEPFGLLLIGEKNSGEPYTFTDLELLVSLTKNLSVIINQIRMKNQILQAQELELLGRMSRGMAHDLNNLLTPIWTFLQLSNEGAAQDDLNEDLLPVALRNIKTMRAYIREALFFSENLRPDFQLGRLDVVVSQAVDLVRSKSEKSVDILVSSPGEVLVEIDEVLIQRLIANIVSNALDASPPNSTIHIELIRLVKTETNRDWLRVRIVDSGEGIKPEDLNRVFTPYFTTKNRGDQQRGFGLGLAICRKIVHLHGGNLNIASQVKKGTTVQIDLPSRQVRPATVAVQ